MTSEQIRAARMLLRWEQKDLAAASQVSLPTIKRLETVRVDRRTLIKFASLERLLGIGQ